MKLLLLNQKYFIIIKTMNVQTKMQTKNKITIILFLGIILLAGIFRFWQIWDLPGGLYSDESANGLDVLDILSGKNRAVFYETNYGREGLFFYLLALSVKIFGIGVWQMKIVSGFLGIITIMGLYLLAKNLFNRTIALLSCFFAAVSIPYGFLGRIAFRANLMPAIIVFLFYFGIRALRDKKNQYFYSFLAGGFLALGFYTYISFRIVPFLIFAFIIILEIIFRRARDKTSIDRAHHGFILANYKILLVASLAFFIVVSPLAFYFYQHPGSFFGRANDVSILNSHLSAGPLFYLVRNLGLSAAMFNVYGDANWRHNFSGRPFFDPATGVLFLIGIMIAAVIFCKSAWRVLKNKDKSLRETLSGYLLIFGLFFAMLIPMIATEESIPHFLRAIGIIPIVFIFPAIGLRALFLRVRHRPIFLGFLLLLLITFVVNYNFWLYFKETKNSYGYYTAYYGDLTLVSNYINREANNNFAKSSALFLVLDDKANRTPAFLTSPKNNPYTLILPNQELNIAYPKKSKIIFPSLSFNQVSAFETQFPEARLVHEEYNRFGEKALEVYSF